MNEVLESPKRKASKGKTRPSAQDWMDARQLYEKGGADRTAIARLLNVMVDAVDRRARREGWKKPALDLDGADTKPVHDPQQAAARLFRAFEAQMSQVEHILLRQRNGETVGGEVEKTARMLASLARTLDTLIELNAQVSKPEEDARDAETLREELARRLAGLREEQSSS